MTLTNLDLNAIKGANLYKERLRDIQVDKNKLRTLMTIEEENIEA
jgi:hypothetical protein